MKHRLVVATGVTVFLLSSVVGVGVAQAHGKITATGQISCSSSIGASSSTRRS